jgi:two-component system, cell cycle response regulator DivK
MAPQSTFLYVEDDPISREVMELMLHGLGYSAVTILDSSADFMARIQALPTVPDVIFLDIHMQPHDGFEMLARLREHPVFGTKRIVAVTASVMNEEVQRLRDAGFDGAIGKPLDFDNFAPLIERILKGESIWHIV